MHLELSEEEASFLERVMSGYLPALRELVYKTENYDWRQQYKRDEQLLAALLERLRSRGREAPGGDVPAEALLTDVGPSIAPS
ncbi:MAG TPA: hypothetical protein VNN10_03890 [Dehalococcoidia bacterium]|nr:hypothetical protein [Dehalococcoidia bacterium]